MISARLKGSVTIWAWALSIVFHALLLALFAIVGFSKSTGALSPTAPPKISVNQIKQLTQTPIISPKPKIKNTASPVKTPLTSQRFTLINDTDNKNSSPPDTTAQDVSHLASVLMPPHTTASNVPDVLSTHAVDLRKICYVVDCSASMFGRLTFVQKYLKASINDLRPDQFFYIIFFLEGQKLFESGNGKLIRATERAKLKASLFIDTARLGGTTDAKFALKRAMKIKDSASKPPQVIFFLTDGFDLNKQTAADFPARIQQLSAQLAPDTIINTIAFQPTPNDRQILKTISEQTGGQFTDIE
jgi:hypothetical protein